MPLPIEPAPAPELAERIRERCLRQWAPPDERMAKEERNLVADVLRMVADEARRRPAYGLPGDLRALADDIERSGQGESDG